MSTALVLLWLAALPCEDSAREVHQLTQMAAETPEVLDAYFQEMELRWEGLPLRGPTGATPEQRVTWAARRLQETCAQLEAARREPDGEVRTDQALLKDILSRPEFAQARQRQGDVLQRVLRLLKEWLESLLETRQAQTFATSTRTVVLVLGFAVVLFALLRLRHWRGGPVRKTERGEPGPTALRLDSPGEHLARARAALGAQPREAIRQGLLAMLSMLEERKLARPDRVKTNRELVGELPGRGAPERLTRDVERLVGWYDRAFYSLEPVPPEDAVRFVDEVERFQKGLEGATA